MIAHTLVQLLEARWQELLASLGARQGAFLTAFRQRLEQLPEQPSEQEIEACAKDLCVLLNRTDVGKPIVEAVVACRAGWRGAGPPASTLGSQITPLQLRNRLYILCPVKPSDASAAVPSSAQAGPHSGVASGGELHA